MPAWSIINAPKFTNVAIGGLQAAILSARPGEVITVPTAGAATNIVLNGCNIAGYGVCVLLPLDQVVRVVATSSSGLHFFGGLWSADIILGTQISGSYAADMTTCSKCSWHGAKFTNSSNALNLNNCTDIQVNEGCLFELSRADHIQASSLKRFDLSNSTFGLAAGGNKFCYYSDGRPPVESISSAACAASGGTWEDTTHNDDAQLLANCDDISVIGNNFASFSSQGLVNFDSVVTLEYMQRVRVWDNTFTDKTAWGIALSGRHIDVRRNVITAEPDGFVRLQVTRQDAGAPIFGGQNTCPIINSPSGVDLGSPILNGDSGVIAPTPPAIVLPPWRPTTPVPVPTVENFAPYKLSGGGIRPNVNPPLNSWISLNKGQWVALNNSSTMEYRLMRNGVQVGSITAAPVFQITSPFVSGDTVGIEARGTNAFGPGEWATYPTLTVA